MDVYLRTRGKARNLDYKWLGRSPATDWWQKYGRLAAFENPTIILVNSPQNLKLFVSGITSNRFDQTGTPIRYSLCVETTDKLNNHAILRLITKLIDDFHAGRASSLAAFFDERFDEKSIDRCLVGRDTFDFQRLPDLLNEYLDRFQPIAALGKLFTADSWIADLKNSEAIGYFSASVEKILNASGSAFLLNLVENVEDVIELVREKNGPIAILANDSSITSITSLDDNRHGKIREPEGPKVRESSVSGKTKCPVCPITALFLFIILIVVWVAVSNTEEKKTFV